jgi:hypothetical protein
MMQQARDRYETGPLQFEGDWSGIFIRGDDALSYAGTLRRLFASAEERANAGTLREAELSDWMRVQALAELLASCRATCVQNGGRSPRSR